MKKKLVVLLALSIVTPSVALAATNDASANGRTRESQPQLFDSGNPTSTIHSTSRDDRTIAEQEKPEDYEGAMVSITQRFSAALAAIAEAVQQGKISGEQGRELSAELYRVTQMSFQLLRLWREIERLDVERTPDAPSDFAPTEHGEIAMVALPFSSLELNPSLAEYLSLTPSQVAAIEQVMLRERHSLAPLMTQMRITREKLLAIGSDCMNEKQVKSLAQTEAALLSRLIVTNARMQSKIYRVLSPDQQKKLNDLERAQGASSGTESGQDAD